MGALRVFFFFVVVVGLLRVVMVAAFVVVGVFFVVVFFLLVWCVFFVSVEQLGPDSECYAGSYDGVDEEV